jgi:hypothetical protein
VIDTLQHQTAEGPCLDAIAEGMMVYADDLVDDVRWPQFGPQAAEQGIRSALALPLASNGTKGAVNLYAHYPAAFGVVDRAKGVILASLASVASRLPARSKTRSAASTTCTPPSAVVRSSGRLRES